MIKPDNRIRIYCSIIMLQRILKMLTTNISFVASSTQEQNKQVIRQFFEAFDRHDTERIGQLVSSTDYTFHFLGMPPMDWNGHKQFIITITNAFPDVHHEIIDMVAEGEDKVADRFNITGTHKGEFQGIPPTGKKTSFGGMQFCTIINGKITEIWANVDMMALMQQIGAIPATSSASGTSATGS
jgi:steroid delta-isomerase-like uncharacterized protein